MCAGGICGLHTVAAIGLCSNAIVKKLLLQYSVCGYSYGGSKVSSIVSTNLMMHGATKPTLTSTGPGP